MRSGGLEWRERLRFRGEGEEMRDRRGARKAWGSVWGSRGGGAAMTVVSTVGGSA